MEVQGVSCTTCTKKQSMIMAYLYRKNRSPFWYIQYVDSDRKKHDKSTGFRADDPNDTVKASSVSCEPNRCRLRGNLMRSLRVASRSPFMFSHFDPRKTRKDAKLNSVLVCFAFPLSTCLDGVTLMFAALKRRSVFRAFAAWGHFDDAGVELAEDVHEVALGGHDGVDVFVNHRDLVEAGGD